MVAAGRVSRQACTYALADACQTGLLLPDGMGTGINQQERLAMKANDIPYRVSPSLDLEGMPALKHNGRASHKFTGGCTTMC